MDERTKQLLILGREHYEKREFEKADALLRQVLEVDDRLADVHNMLGVMSHARGNFIAAEAHFERALSINPHYTEAALSLAVTYNDRGKYDKAREVYTRIQSSARPQGPQSLDPFAKGKLANMHAEVGQAYADLGLSSEAIVEYEKATSLCPEFADLQTKLGNLLRQRGELVQAKARYEAALGARSGYIPARIQLGVTLLALGDSNAAGDQWSRVLEHEPENSVAKMYLRTLETSGKS